MENKQLLFSTAARRKVSQGVNIIADAVKSTLGPKGRNVLIQRQYGGPRITKDGVSVAKEIKVADQFQNLGVEIIKSVAGRTADLVGDGTTTATVLAQAIVTEGLKAVENGANPMDIKRGIDFATEQAIRYIREKSRPIDINLDYELLLRIATISANNDEVMGRIIVDAVKAVHSDKGTGVVNVKESETTETTVDVVTGLQFDRGYLNPYFVTNPEKMQAELKNAFVLVSDYALGAVEPFVDFLDAVLKSGQPLLIIADDVTGPFMQTLLVNKVRLRENFPICVVKTPAYGDKKKEMMEDIALITGATVFSESMGHSPKDLNTSMLGRAANIIVTRDTTTIVGGTGDPNKIGDTIKALQAQINNIRAGSQSYDVLRLEERVARLLGGISVINVGGSSELEIKEKKDRIDDAVAATKAALDSGIVAGGGSSFLYAHLFLRQFDLSEFSDDKKLGISVVREALLAPTTTIVDNAGGEGITTVNELLESIFNSDRNGFIGYNAAVGSHVNDMLVEGIVDPTKVVQLALENAASVSGLLITTEVAIVEEPKEEKCSCKQ